MAMIEARHIETAGTATIVYALAGGGVSTSAPPVANQASSWLSRDIKVIEATIATLTPPGGAASRRIQFQRAGTTQGGNTDLTDGNANVRAVVNGTIVQPVLADFSQTAVYRLTDTGAPAGEVAAIAYLYEDLAIPQLSLYGAGTGPVNLGVGATPQFLGFNMTSVVAAEVQAQQMVPLPMGVTGTFQRIRARFTNGADNTYNLEFRKNGVAMATIAIPTVGGTATFVVDNAQAVSVARGDRVCWRLVRTAGVDSTIAMYVCIGFTVP